MQTSNYEMFKSVGGNRDIYPRHVESLTAAIERKNLLQYYPILVNENFEIIDGQHRLMAAMKLGLPVYYERVEGLRIEDVMSINTNSKTWTLQDFIDAYVLLGYSAYQTLVDFMERHKTPASLSAGLLAGYTARLRGGGTIAASIRNGTFTIGSLSYAERMIAKLDEISQYCEFKARHDRDFVQTIMILNNNKDFDWDKLMAKLKMHGLRIQSRNNVNYYLLHIEELYNFNAKIRTELYASSQV